MCENCGIDGPRNCCVCRSYALASLPSRSAVYPAEMSRRGLFAAVALILCGLGGLLALAVAALVGW